MLQILRLANAGHADMQPCYVAAPCAHWRVSLRRRLRCFYACLCTGRVLHCAISASLFLLRGLAYYHVVQARFAQAHVSSRSSLYPRRFGWATYVTAYIAIESRTLLPMVFSLLRSVVIFPIGACLPIRSSVVLTRETLWLSLSSAFSVCGCPPWGVVRHSDDYLVHCLCHRSSVSMRIEVQPAEGNNRCCAVCCFRLAHQQTVPRVGAPLY